MQNKISKLLYLILFKLLDERENNDTEENFLKRNEGVYEIDGKLDLVEQSAGSLKAIIDRTSFTIQGGITFRLYLSMK